MSEYTLEKAIASGLLFGAASAAGKSMFRKCKRFIRKFKNSCRTTKKYADFYLSEGCK